MHAVEHDIAVAPTDALAAYAAGLRFEALPAAVVEHVKLCVLDALGCALFATGLPWSRLLEGYVADMAGRPDATLWGTDRKVPAANAALLNGTLIHGFELDDLHKLSILHATATALPAALALAEARPGTTGRDLVTALVAGYEVGIRAGMAAGTQLLLRGFHPTGTTGAIAAAVAAGRLIGLDAVGMRDAIGIGATQGAGLMAAQFESMAKRMHAGRAAQSGVYAAELAARGFVGIEGVLEHDYGGFLAAFSGDGAEPSLLTAGLGETFETLKIGFKRYSCCGSVHTTVEAIRAIRAAHGVSAGDVAGVEVDTTTATFLHVGWPYRPGGLTRAQMNLRYAAAVTLMDGDAFVDQYTEARLADPATLALIHRIDVRPAEDLDALGPTGRHTVRLRLTGRDGARHEIRQSHAKGNAADPLDRAEVLAKYAALAGPVLGADGAEALRAAVLDLDRMPEVGRLSGLLVRR